MDILLGKVTQQAMNYAIRSGITITSGYAIRQCGRLLKATPKGSNEREELVSLQMRLESKIRIISPAIDMIELIAARGNTTLESAVTLTKDLRWEIQALGVRLAAAANDEELLRKRSSKARSREQNELELKLVVSDIRKLLLRIEDAVPLINLAITTSGVSLSSTLPATVSPSRLLQASTFLTAGDTVYSTAPTTAVQIGPVYVLSMYMLFAGHAWRPHDEEGVRETTWKEVIHKARVKLVRVPLDRLYDLPEAEIPGGLKSNGGNADHSSRNIPSEAKSLEFAYQLIVIEDLDDDRVHSFEDGDVQPGPYYGVTLAGIRDVIPIHEISKIFYADTGKILNIGSEGEVNSPILLLKRDINAEAPRRMMERQRTEEPQWYDQEPARTDKESKVGKSADQRELDDQLFWESSVTLPEEPANLQPPRDHWRLPPALDPEWIAFEVYTEEPDSDAESEPETSESDKPSPRSSSFRQESLDPNMIESLSALDLHSSSRSASATKPQKGESNHSSSRLNVSSPAQQVQKGPKFTQVGPIRTSLSLLEMLIRLTALQQFRQTSHLAIEDELLNFFLEDSSTTGAGPDSDHRRRVRRDARRRVGFDPYDESPVKRRGEDYLQHAQHEQSQYREGTPNGYYSPRYYRDEYDPGQDIDGNNTPGFVRQSIEDYPRPRSQTPSSPSPHNMRDRERSSRANTPARAGATHMTPGPQVQQRYSSPVMATPPVTAKSRQAFLRSEVGRGAMPRSPLGQGVNGETDSTLGSSPPSDEFVAQGESSRQL
ncbi:hypothetical protein LTR04_007114 [Oleoguttula sp. CCFEE 6159]|nr:hypothetical protein LTR04_007114 [Oleoguttula sp. CCFEE 6159]